MMKKYSLLLLMGAFLFASCSKDDSTSTTIPQPFDPATFFQNKVTQMVLFQFEEVNELTGERSGWFIDKSGNVKSYDASDVEEALLPNGVECSSDDLLRLYNLSNATHLSIEADELYDNYQLITIVGNAQVSNRADGEGEISYSYYAFEAPDPTYSSAHGDCEDERDIDTPENCNDTYGVILLEETGAYLQSNLSPTAPGLVEWLESIKENANL